MATSSSPGSPIQLRVALFSTAAGAMVGALIMVYALAGTRHAWPSGHPWSAISILCFVYISYAAALRNHRTKGSTWGSVAAVALAIAGTAFWVSAAILRAT